MNKKIIVLPILLLICLGSCRKATGNLTTYNEQLAGLKETKVYKDVQERANKDLKKWLSAGLEEAKVLNDCNWKVDGSVNDSFIESNYTSDLKKRHQEFLQQLNH